MTKKELMIKAHEMTREIKREFPEVYYKFQLGLCLAYLQSEGGKEMTIEEKLLELGYKTWTKGMVDTIDYKKRIYINNIEELANKLNIEVPAKALRRDTMYFDCLDNHFYFSVSSSRKSYVNAIIEELRK